MYETLSDPKHINGKAVYIIIFTIAILFTRIFNNGNKFALFIGEFFASYSVWRIFGGSHIRSMVIALITAIPHEVDKYFE